METIFWYCFVILVVVVVEVEVEVEVENKQYVTTRYFILFKANVLVNYNNS